MTETIYVRGEGGAIFAMDLPLHPGADQRFNARELVQVNAVSLREVSGDRRIHAVELPLPDAHQVRIDRGELVQVNPDGTPYDGQVTPERPRPSEIERPADSANKPEWVAYAVGKGAAEDEASAFTKAELIELYGQD